MLIDKPYPHSSPGQNYSMPGPVQHAIQTLFLAIIKIVLIGGAVSYNCVFQGFEHVTYLFLVMGRSCVVFAYFSYMLFNLIHVQLALFIHTKLKGLAIITLVCVLMGFLLTEASAAEISFQSELQDYGRLKSILSRFAEETNDIDFGRQIEEALKKKTQVLSRTPRAIENEEQENQEKVSELSKMLKALALEAAESSQKFVEELDNSLNALQNDVCLHKLSSEALINKHCGDHVTLSQALTKKLLRWKEKANDLMYLVKLFI